MEIEIMEGSWLGTGSSCDVEEGEFLTFCETDVKETCFYKTVDESVVEICERTFAHGNTKCLDRDYHQMHSSGQRGGRGGTFESFKEMITLKNCIVFSSMPWKFRNNTHQTLIRTFRTLPTIRRLPSNPFIKGTIYGGGSGGNIHDKF